MNWIGFYTLIEREIYRFMRLFNQTVMPPLVTTVMYILIFGYSLGSHIKEIEGVSYIVYILPGLVQMSVITNAYANSSTSLFMARMERSIENFLVAPLKNFQIVSALMLGGLLRGMVVATTIILVSSFFVDFPSVNWFLVFSGIFFTSILFSGLGIISALWSESWDKIATFTNFVITPFIYLGGVFYSIKMLPPLWYKVSHLNPIFYCVDLVRFGFLGVTDTNPFVSLAIVSTSAVAIYLFCVYLFWRGYKMVK
jgi:ABC-2 type transport system permease protein